MVRICRPLILASLVGSVRAFNQLNVPFIGDDCYRAALNARRSIQEKAVPVKRVD